MRQRLVVGSDRQRVPSAAGAAARLIPPFGSAVQSDQLPLSTWLVAPTSTSARAASFRPEVEIEGQVTRVLAEQTAAVDPGRLGNSVGYLSLEESRRVDAALRIVLDL
ncbi:type II toxin-antitoxin system PemK/MazF family toxin [Mycobacterium sp. IEC1808]|uniref:type II toxin-antitoxin system PemK/MazF family toxin n=1 Tax=Mycobacterium sp. IEC1808 TaxID=1743230 RepID=UPI001150DE79|nr:type II toxin-antitoxin system PemK/MazF family toxin [Mycobacterium sp. IEC1808]